MSGSIVRPASSSELAAFLSAADKDGIAVVPGAEIRLPAGCDARETIACDLGAIDQVLEHSVPDQVIEVGTGISIRKLNEVLAKNRQMLPVRVPQNWLVADALNAGESGTLEHGYGAMRDLVLGCSATLADGTQIKTGGRVVKNVTGYDVTKLLIGSQATLAIASSVYLRVYAVPDTSLTLLWSFDTLWKMMNTALKLVRSGLPFAALEAVCNDKPQSAVGKYVLFGQIYGLAAVCEEIANDAKKLVGSPQAELQGPDELALWSDIAEFFLGTDPASTVHIVAPPSELPNIAGRLPHRIRWQMRPSRGRLTAVVADVAETLGSMEELARESNIAISVGAADKGYNYRMRRYPVIDAAQTALKRRIKEQLDPRATLNPYVAI